MRRFLFFFLHVHDCKALLFHQATVPLDVVFMLAKKMCLRNDLVFYTSNEHKPGKYKPRASIQHIILVCTDVSEH